MLKSGGGIGGRGRMGIGAPMMGGRMIPPHNPAIDHAPPAPGGLLNPGAAMNGQPASLSLPQPPSLAISAPPAVPPQGLARLKIQQPSLY